MNHDDGMFEGAGGLRLYCQSWQPEGPPRAVLAIVHGINEHSGRYLTLVNHLVPLDYAVYGFDHRGHGRSPGRRGHITRWEEYRDDVGAFLRLVGDREKRIPLFLFGHSLGALIVMEYVLRRPEGVRGAIVASAPFEPVGVGSPFLVAVARLLSRTWPGFTLPVRIDPSVLSRDPQVVRAFLTDPLVHRMVTARWGTECLAAIGWVKAHAADVRLPLLLLHGGADRVNAAAGSRAFFAQVSHPDKTLRVYDDAYHELHNDLDCDTMVRDIAHWMDDRIL